MAPSPSFQPLKGLAFRLYMTPQPRTQSDSNAILRALQKYGPISVFQITSRAPLIPTDNKSDVEHSAVANLIFSRGTGSKSRLKSLKTHFTVTLDANIPDASVQDPYNVRGLRNRKPPLRISEIKCHLVPFEDCKETRRASTQDILDEMSCNQYNDEFSVDRNSVFGEILAKTDCPSGLIHGLLPKVEDPRRAPKQWKHASGHDVESQYMNTENGQKKEMEQGNSSRLHKEYIALGNLSLMQMYRDAVDEDTPVVSTSVKR